VIVDVDEATDEGRLGGEKASGNRELGPIRLPTQDADGFILQFNQHYRSLGLELQKQENEKIPDSQKTAGDLNDDSSPAATDHRT
jgi:hypothetical protein